MELIELDRIGTRFVDGQAVFFMKEQVIANGEEARQFVRDGGGSETDEVVSWQDVDPDGTGFDPPPPSFKFIVSDPEQVVAEAHAAGLRVQFNHVLFAHGECQCDPCCGQNPYGAFPLKASPLKASPLKASPLKASAPTKTTATDPQRGAGKSTDARSDNEVVVWVLDTGVSSGTATFLHDEIVANGDQTDQPDEDGNRKVDPVAGHGTFIAGIVERLTPGCTIRVYDQMDMVGHVVEWNVAFKIGELLKSPPDGVDSLSRTLLNLSFGGGMETDCNWCLADAVKAAQQLGIVVVASAGNDGSCVPTYPGDFAEVIAVGALDRDGDPADFTNRGEWVDACALGVDIVSEFFDFSNVAGQLQPHFSGWAQWSGTSFGAPVVVGLIAHEMTNHGTAVEARDALLSGRPEMPCLGVRVHDDSDVQALLGIMI